MPASSEPLAPAKPAARSRVSNYADLLPNVDGRSVIARRYRDILAAIIADQGGLDRMGEARVQLARRFAACCVLAEALEARLANGEAIDVSEHAQLTSTMVRVASRIGINREPREIIPDPLDYARRYDTDEAEEVE